MPLQIANPKVVAKVEKLARAMGLTKTARVERAVDRLGADIDASRAASRFCSKATISAQPISHLLSRPADACGINRARRSASVL